MGNDLRAAFRALSARPAFTALALLTLALGIGASASLFSLLDAVYFRPLPLLDAERLVRISRPSAKSVYGLLSHPEIVDLAANLSAAPEVVAIGGRGVTLRQGDASRMLIVQYVSADFFRVLGIPLAHGRGFERGDAARPEPLVVVNHQLWRDVLGARPEAVGGPLRLNDTAFTVVGVTAPDFLGLDRTYRSDVFVLVEHARFAVGGLADEVADRGSRWFEAFARLAPGASLEQARAQAAEISRRWEGEDARAYAGTRLALESVGDAQRTGARRGAVFLALVALVLAIAAANAAHLMLVRAESRRQEWAVRAALGAASAHRVRALVAESVLLTLGGALAGLALAFAAMRAFPALVPPTAVPIVLDARFDGRLLAFTALLALATAGLVAAVPGLRYRRLDVVAELRLGRSPGGDRSWGLSDLLVAGQMAVSVVVLIAAGLLGRSLAYSSRIDAGFAADKRLATFYVVPALQGRDQPATLRYFEQARERAAALPGVVATSYALRLPAQGNEAGWATDVSVPGQDPPPGEQAFRIRFGIVGPAYFEVMGARLLRGRGVAAEDGPEATPVAVVNRTLAERMWPGQDAIGRTLLVGRSRTPRVVVGVAENGRIASVHEPPEMYFFVPFAQQPQGFALLLVETAGEPEAIFGAVRRELAQIAPDVPVLEASTLGRHRAVVLFDERRDAAIGAVAGALALALGAVGLYGVVSLVAVRRTREFGVRIALGASRAHVLGLVLSRGLRLAAAGGLVGALLALAGSGALGSRLHGVPAVDPVAFLGGGLVLLVAALLASVVPALRATRADPLDAIRAE